LIRPRGQETAERFTHTLPLGRLVAAGCGVGVLALLLYELTAEGFAQGARGVGAGLVVAAASTLSGLLVGFVFGVPRALSQPAEPARERYGANTNLEQISDWLTKILVGVGLTQFRAIGEAAGRLFGNVAPLFGSRGDAPFAGALIVLFATLGFLLGWLAARLLLPVAMVAADREQRDIDRKLRQAKEAEQRGDLARAAELRVEVSDRLLDPTTLARAYTQERQRTPPGAHRTARMEVIAANARRLGAADGLTKAAVQRMLRTGDDGERVVALAAMQGNPELLDVDAVLDAIGRSHSAFEQYHALLTLDTAWDRLTADQQRAGRDVILQQQRDQQGFLKPENADRWALSNQLLARYQG
jgi:hypothetical protein